MKPSPAFEQWFGDSKVVDVEGQPLVVYHGSPSKFTKFDLCSSMDGGFYFTESKRVAESFSRDEDGEMISVMATYLSLQNPKIIDLAGQQQPSQDEMRVIFTAAKAQGHDGALLLRVLEFNGAGTQYVAFDHTQITSATARNDFLVKTEEVTTEAPSP